MITVYSSLPAYYYTMLFFLRIFTSLIPLNFRLYPDYSSISHSRFLSKNGDGVGIFLQNAAGYEANFTVFSCQGYRTRSRNPQRAARVPYSTSSWGRYSTTRTFSAQQASSPADLQIPAHKVVFPFIPWTHPKLVGIPNHSAWTPKAQRKPVKRGGRRSDCCMPRLR